jgi:hypothetical protein
MINSNRRLLVGLPLIALMTTGAVAAQAKTPPKKKVVRQTQTVTFNYTSSLASHTAAGPGLQPCVGAAPTCFAVHPPGWAKYMTIGSSDKSGQATPISLWLQSGKQVDSNSKETFVCGSTRNSPVSRGSTWSLSVDVASVDPKCPGPATTGTVTVKFSNLP